MASKRDPESNAILLTLILLAILFPIVSLFIPLDKVYDPVTKEFHTEKHVYIIAASIWAISLASGVLYYKKQKRLKDSTN